MLHMKNVLFLLLGLAASGQAKSSCSTDSDCLSNEVCARPIGSNVDYCLPVSLPEEGDTFTRRLKCSNGDIGEPGSPACEGYPAPSKALFFLPGRKLKQGETTAGEARFLLNPSEEASGTPVNCMDGSC